MYTYIIKSYELYKIGKAIDVERRINSFKTGNPVIERIKIIDGNYESYLHTKYKNKRVKGEWFKLSIEDITEIEELVKSEKERRESEKENTQSRTYEEYNPKYIEYTKKEEERRDRDNDLQAKSVEAWNEGLLIMNDYITISIGIGEDGKSIVKKEIVREENKPLIMSEQAIKSLIEDIEQSIRKAVAIKCYI